MPQKTPRVLIAGNWKMNGLRASLKEGTKLAKFRALSKPRCEIAICPPAQLLFPLKEVVKGARIAIGGQDCHPGESGAHTGDVSAEMIKDAGGRYVIVGHSERRADHGETDRTVASKAVAGWRAGLTTIICVGETEKERNSGKARQVVGRQIKGSLPEGATSANVVIAYEPVWAIGTGRTPSTDEIEEIHHFIRNKLVTRLRDDGQRVRILYGGSVKPGNAKEILRLTDVNGALVGGASLKASDFWGIVDACP